MPFHIRNFTHQFLLLLAGICLPWLSYGQSIDVSLNDGYLAACEENYKVDTYGLGLLSSWVGSSQIVIPNPGDVSHVVVEATYRRLYSGCTPVRVLYSTNLGQRATPGGTPINNDNQTLVYRSQFDGGVSQVLFRAPVSCRPVSFLVHVFRKDPTANFIAKGIFVDEYVFNRTTTKKISIPTSRSPRDIRVQFPVMELGACTSEGEVSLVAGASSTTQIIKCQGESGKGLGNDVTLVSMTLEQVPGDVSELDLVLNSCGFSCASFYVSGLVNIEIDQPDCSRDTDQDGIADWTDADDDGDGLSDLAELFYGDHDQDSIPDFADEDFCAQLFASTGYDCSQGFPDPSSDIDGDGNVNYSDADFVSCGALENGVCVTFDADGDGVPNHLDLDSDNDGIPDIVEAGGVDPEGDGLPLCPPKPFAQEVNLTVTDDGGNTSTFTSTIFPGVNFPTARFDAATNYSNSLQLNVDAAKTNGNDIISYDWDFGDGTTGSGPTAQHVYAVAGPYTVKLTVTDASGLTNTTARQVILGAVSANGLLALYNFTEGSGSVVRDISGSDQPLDLTITNPAAVSWNKLQGLTLNGETALLSNGPASNLTAALKATNAVTIEAWLAPANNEQAGPARIVTLSGSEAERNVTLAQESSEYVARLRTTSTDLNGLPNIGSGDKTLVPQLQHVVFSRQPNGQYALYIDGVLRSFASRSGNFSNWADNYSLILANEANGERPWLGTLYSIAIYDRAFSGLEVFIRNRSGKSIWAGKALSASFTARALESDPYQIQFDASSSEAEGSEIVSYQWSFGGGLTDSLKTPVADYNNVGMWDDNGDGLCDWYEYQLPLSVVDDSTTDDLIVDPLEPVRYSVAFSDQDGDGIPNFLDHDSDNDGILDVAEVHGIDSDRNGQFDGSAGENGMNQLLDPNVGGTAIIANAKGEGNEILWPETAGNIIDFDGDNIPDFLDSDSDADGIVDNVEAQSTGCFVGPIEIFSDLGVDLAYANYQDCEQYSTPTGSSGLGIQVVDFDGDSIPDYLDTDTDSDGATDFDEAYDFDNDGVSDLSVSGIDLDLDGLDDNLGTRDSVGVLLGQFPSDFAQNDSGINLDWRYLIPVPNSVIDTLVTINFRVSMAEDEAVVEWNIDPKDQENDYLIQRSTDGLNFTTIGDGLLADNFEQDGMLGFRLNDEDVLNLETERVWYRLVQKSPSGELQARKSSILEIDGARSSVIAYPNPAEKRVNLAFELSVDQPVYVRIMDISGRVHYNASRFMKEGMNEIDVNIENWASGVYFAEVQTGNKVRSCRFVIR